MAKKRFILQGITPRTHVQAVCELFDVPEIRKVLVGVAFVSESGVQQIEAALKPYADSATVYAGIRNDITSWQGLARLHKIGVELHTVDTGTRSIVFHPKLYYVRGKYSARLLLGSANLTLGGLNNNIEAGMTIELDLADEDDKKLAKEIEAHFSSLPAQYPEHVMKVGAVSTLDALLASGRLIDETAAGAPHPATLATSTGGDDSVPRIKLKVTPLRSALTRAKTGVAPSKPVPPKKGVEFELVWESKPLTRRDLTIPDAKGTHPTGSVNLDKGLLDEAVDHRHYFRDDVFAHLSWSARSDTVDEAYAKFQLVIKGVGYGEFDLPIRHTTSTKSAAYIQRNAMTRLSWGPMKEYVAHPHLIGRNLALYRDKAESTLFILEID